MNKNVLVIKTDMMLNSDTMETMRKKFLQEVEEGVVIIPPYFECEIIQVPDGVEIQCRHEKPKTHEFLTKKFNIKKEKK